MKKVEGYSVKSGKEGYVKARTEEEQAKIVTDTMLGEVEMEVEDPRRFRVGMSLVVEGGEPGSPIYEITSVVGKTVRAKLWKGGR